ncbi:hypothetical protein HORIV_56660 [Vreelandella olivaria]|uniref:ABC transporter domain-containing protein n=1 Tax=Vreelandella olivaria TaxID=390919 RepID=A0ABM7GQD7_9GAMM|nr:hypothetical protein HORIV_56660 [Halomonas olivaria]
MLENVTFGLKHLAARERRERAAQLLEQLGMAAYMDVYPHMLSGGQQQRVALARALAPSPRLMLLDEPFSSLDARLRDRIRDDTLHVLKKVGAATLLVTHDPEEAMFMADRIALMRDGRIVQTGTPASFTARLKTLCGDLFGDVNELQGKVHNGAVSTPVGRVPAPGLAEGSDAQIMIRPEALRIVERDLPAGEHGHSHVVMAKLLGRTSLLHLCAHGENGLEAHLHARVPGYFYPQKASRWIFTSTFHKSLFSRSRLNLNQELAPGRERRMAMLSRITGKMPTTTMASDEVEASASRSSEARLCARTARVSKLKGAE